MQKVNENSLDIAAVGASSQVSKKQTSLWAYSQWLLCRMLQIPLYAFCSFLMRFVGAYRIEGVRELRRQYKEIAKTPGPLIICSNHLTFIDSMLVIWALGSNLWYLFNFQRFSWNLPAGDFFKQKWHYRLLANIGKCIFIHRDGSKEHKDAVVNMCRGILEAGETITFFPEGRRSRSGRFEIDRLTYGVGKLVTMIGPCRILCIYLRSDKQETYSSYPPRGSSFKVATKLLHVAPQGQGRESYQLIMARVGSTIKKMEDNYFAQKSAKI